MGDKRGFLTKKRMTAGYRPADERVKDFREVERRLPEAAVAEQGSRCMDCGVPFCHAACPVGNVIPDWNDLIFRGQWKRAVEVLQASNNFPEFTGRVCPALCESACVIGISDDPVTIRQNEIAIIEWGFDHGVIRPFVPRRKTGKRVAVVGAGPAGMACAQQLTRAGHDVTLFEADDKAGGILRYGIPDFKLEKWVIDRRLDQMRAEGTAIETGARVTAEQVSKDFDALCLTIGAREPRDLNVEGRELSGVHFAMDFLTQNNRRVAGAAIPADLMIDARGKHVIVIGGGDTGADCVGTANRQGAASVLQLEVLPKPPACRTKEMPWPTYPKTLKTTSSHEEGCVRRWSIATKKLTGENGRVRRIHCVEVGPDMKEIPGTDVIWNADLVILAMGFTRPVHQGLVADLGVKTSPRGSIAINRSFQTSHPKVFAAGDASRGASLVVWAISDGRDAAREIDRVLMGETNLP